MTKKKDEASQQRIARDLGVSQALVSLVLNGKRDNISEDSYQRIWTHALKVGYRPKGVRFDSGTAPSLGVGFMRAGVRLHTQSNFFSHVQHGLHAGLLGRGYHTVYLGSEDDPGPGGPQQFLHATRLCEEEHPQITGSHSNPEQLGMTAAELLLQGASGLNGIFSDVVLPSRLTIRETSGKPPG